jgi:DNA repair exonuclease SbcCD ATPase subunit
VRILHVAVENFGSYEKLDLDLASLGLTLIHGKTGSGKSTLQDMARWILFGETSNGGGVDEVRNWTKSAPTVGHCELLLADSKIAVTRIRGKSTENDLYWTIHGYEKQHRGKDIKETQKLLEKQLGVSSDLYASGGIFNEFSPSGSFFSLKAEKRRQVLENLAKLDFPVRLNEKASDERKSVRAEIRKLDLEYSAGSGKLQALQVSHERTLESERRWGSDVQRDLESLGRKSLYFSVEKNQKVREIEAEIETLRKGVKGSEQLEKELAEIQAAIDQASVACKTCGGPVDYSHKNQLIYKRNDLFTAFNKNQMLCQRLEQLSASLSAAQTWENPYDAQIREKAEAPNPFTTQLDQIEDDIDVTEAKLVLTSERLAYLKERDAALGHLADLSQSLRATLLDRAVRDLEAKTNEYLETYFGSEIRIAFSLEGADRLEVSIKKSGYDSHYTRLSRGQRCMLKLCFGVSLMKASANANGVHFDQLFFDEVLDGLDTDLKLQAFGLFEKLATEHSGVFLTDHCDEFKQMFDTKIRVSMVGDTSEVELVS